MFASSFRTVLRPLVCHVIHAMLDDKLIEVFGFPRPSRIIRKLVASALRMCTRLSGWLLSRKEPRLRAELAQRSYAAGYEIGRIGPLYQQSRRRKPSYDTGTDCRRKLVSAC